MKTFIAQGDTLNLIAPSGGVLSGSLYLIGSIPVVAVADAAETLPFQGKTTGIFNLPKTSAQAWVPGDPIYRHEGTGAMDNVSTVGAQVGIAVRTEANPTATGWVKLGYVAPVGSEGMQAAEPDVTLTLLAGTANGVTEAIPVPTDTPASADALRDDIATNIIPAIRNNIAEVGTTLNSLLAKLRAAGIITP